MREINECEYLSNNEPTYYMPHHCVLKDNSTTTKLRVVFNASAKSITGVCLNDALNVGPMIQGDLFSRLLQFRTYEDAFTSDISKMYRQILVEPSQTKLQRILWRGNTALLIRTYEPVIVIYGTASASFLAIHCIQKLTEDYRFRYSLGSRVILNNFFVNGVVSESQSLDVAQQMKDKAIEILILGGFELRKWAFNVSELRDEAMNVKPFSEINENNTNETRNWVLYDPSMDTFKFTNARQISKVELIRKRSVLSRISLLFDPLYLLGYYSQRFSCKSYGARITIETKVFQMIYTKSGNHMSHPHIQKDIHV